ncbi:uncharacterized protein LAESUDRAFT_661811 [Laetiporus sulphureus 93-53]|uniref:PB1 domain-containing protein n=1 Tax=Laetiporus sulphureus 93-53 TaxID=1314785 RepID=A0A165C9D5_9APHY|nr:uncharacterized protein LAESUDRAFT_661811 [Laetiporus sulphureus 93-53]KZT02427.1 hypothetical protein LAESUDRAFT_661811 [Laetiporus sulphureus 93-53]
MSLPQLQIKLHRPSDGLIRKITFDTPPSWTTLAAKIEALYHITQADVAVSYLDADGDEITLSSESELQEYYRTLPPGAPGESKVAKLTVRDLGAERNKPLPSTPPTGSSNLHGGFRNTFGVPMMFDVEEEEEWQRVPQALSSLFGVGRDESVGSGPHAFVETIDSEIGGSQAQEQDRDDIVDAITIPDSELTETTPAPTQDKDKGKARANSSQESVIGSQTPDKYPIHVVDLNAMDIDDILEKGRTSPISRSEPVPGQAPRASTASSSTVSDSEAPEPPLPDLENLGNPMSSATSRAPSATVSLTNDVANLFSTLSAVIASHPELSEGVRNLVRNAANGTYWQAHRQAVSRATDDLRRTAEASSADAVRIASEARRAAEEAAGRRVAEAIANVVRAIGDVAGTTANPSDAAPSTSTAHGAQRSFSERRPATFPFPPDFQMAMESLSDLADPRAWMSERGGRRGHGFRHRHGRYSMHQTASAPGSAYASKKQTDKDKGKGKAPAQTEAVPEPPAQIISAARGPYPQLEMLSVSPPRRHHTMHGTGTGTHRAQEASKSKENPAVSSITRRLGDMGFTEDKFPSIYAQVLARVPSQGELSREAEDSVVSDVLEDLLLMSPVQSPQPSGSGAHANQAEDGIPGAFP